MSIEHLFVLRLCTLDAGLCTLDAGLCNLDAGLCILDAGLLARSQYMEGPATGHLYRSFSWFPCVYR
jgi:hypothetical protein